MAHQKKESVMGWTLCMKNSTRLLPKQMSDICYRRVPGWFPKACSTATTCMMECVPSQSWKIKPNIDIKIWITMCFNAGDASQQQGLPNVFRSSSSKIVALFFLLLLFSERDNLKWTDCVFNGRIVMGGDRKIFIIQTTGASEWEPLHRITLVTDSHRKVNKAPLPSTSALCSRRSRVHIFFFFHFLPRTLKIHYVHDK